MGVWPKFEDFWWFGNIYLGVSILKSVKRGLDFFQSPKGGLDFFKSPKGGLEFLHKGFGIFYFLSKGVWGTHKSGLEFQTHNSGHILRG